ncbi:glycosyltransferase family 4 protein [Rhodococcus sp. 1168]|uniref:glycosyltransferase family 4 protein n=1 Tax=Rhodococcus sp. 1168 TaxID=2018041 RepID=UPI000A0C6FE0|nr:glycosyltransferase family 4 protein [Rhodococcus sp. 1168]ORI16249.1 hypothetical protein BJI47_14690 [Rhodococcus sp. 1168]
MRVLRIFHGGVVERYQSRDEELARDGTVVRLIVPTRYRELPDFTIGRPRKRDLLEVTTCKTTGPLRNPLWWYRIAELRKQIDQFSPDVIDVHEEPYSLAMWSVLRSIPEHVPMIFRSSQNVFKSYPLPFSRIQTRAFERSSAAYVPSLQAMDVLKRKGYKQIVEVVGNGVDVPEDEKMSLTKHIGVVQLIFAGRYTERKGFDDLIQAGADIDGLRIHLAGGELPADVVLPENFTDHGILSYNDLTKLFVNCQAICVPSHVLPGWTEQFCRSLVEGMSRYLAPIISTSGALAEVAPHGAIVFPAGSPSALRVALLSLAQMPKDELHLLRIASREKSENYSWPHTSSQIRSLYASAIKEHIR